MCEQLITDDLDLKGVKSKTYKIKLPTRKPSIIGRIIDWYLRGLTTRCLDLIKKHYEIQNVNGQYDPDSDMDIDLKNLCQFTSHIIAGADVLNTSLKNYKSKDFQKLLKNLKKSV